MDKDFLKGKRIAITALELENKEHRGIASFIKSLIHILSKYGAEVYLNTGFDSSQNFKNYSNKDIDNIFFAYSSFLFHTCKKCNYFWNSKQSGRKYFKKS